MVSIIGDVLVHYRGHGTIYSFEGKRLFRAAKQEKIKRYKSNRTRLGWCGRVWVHLLDQNREIFDTSHQYQAALITLLDETTSDSTLTFCHQLMSSSWWWSSFQDRCCYRWLLSDIYHIKHSRIVYWRIFMRTKTVSATPWSPSQTPSARRQYNSAQSVGDDKSWEESWELDNEFILSMLDINLCVELAWLEWRWWWILWPRSECSGLAWSQLKGNQCPVSRCDQPQVWQIIKH